MVSCYRTCAKQRWVGVWVYSAGSAEIVFKETAQIVAETGVSNAKETYAVGQGVGVYTAGGKVDFQKDLFWIIRGKAML